MIMMVIIIIRELIGSIISFFCFGFFFCYFLSVPFCDFRLLAYEIFFYEFEVPKIWYESLLMRAFFSSLMANSDAFVISLLVSLKMFFVSIDFVDLMTVL